jgi:hypothetical protein
MSRLVVFGCSYTYGQGLADCINSKFLSMSHPYPSKLGWAQQLADKLGLKLVNKSYPGSSNFEILFTLLEFKFEPDDVVVIMWSHYIRDMYFTWFYKIPLLRRRLGPWKKTRLAKRWITQLSERDYLSKSWVYMSHATLQLEKYGIKKFIHYPVEPDIIGKYKPDFIEIKNLHLDGLDIVDKALDNSHPGPESNRLTSEKIYRILNEQF